MTNRKAGDRKYQRVCAEGHQIQTHDFKHLARTVHFIRRKVRVQWHSSVDHFPIRTSFSHEAVVTLEIEFLHRHLTERNPKLLTEHIQKMTSGGAPFFATTLSLIYDKLVEKAFPQTTTSGSGLGQSSGTGGQSVTNSTNQMNDTSQGPAHQVANPASNLNTPSTSTPTVPLPSSFQTTAPTPGSSSAAARVAWLVCRKCGRQSRLRDLYIGLLCPICPPVITKKERARMKCQLCGHGRATQTPNCAVKRCQARFM